MARIFISYSHADEDLKVQLEKHLSLLRRSGKIELWNDRMILPGEDFAGRIDASLESADIILLLISHNFIDSNYCFDIEMKRAVERHDAREAKVLPIILDFCMWKSAPFGHLNALPKDGTPIRKYPNINEALASVASEIERLLTSMGDGTTPRLVAPGSDKIVSEHPRSSNLHIRRDFTQMEKDRFVLESFDYIANYFEASLKELKKRSQGLGIDEHFERVEPGTFTAKIYKGGALKSVCTITRRKGMMGDIGYSHSEERPGSSLNDALSLEEKDGALTFKPLMAGFSGRNEKGGLSQQGAADYFWGIFFEPLKR